MLEKTFLRKQFPLRRLATSLLLAMLLFFTFSVGSASAHAQVTLVGPKQHYLAVGDSLAFGFQPDLDFSHGYADYLYSNLKGHGTTSLANFACSGETSTTMIKGGCPYSYLRKYPYVGDQLDAALLYLYLNPGKVSPVTLDIGANDIKGSLNTSTCATDVASFNAALAQLDANLTQVILPKIRAALTVNGVVTGDIVVMNYYDPYQNICPNSVPYTQLVNQHLAQDVAGYGLLADVFSRFGGTTTPNPNICTYTWMCSVFKDIHSKDAGYQVIAQTFEDTLGY